MKTQFQCFRLSILASVLLFFVPRAFPFSFEELKTLIEEQKIISVEQLQNVLPLDYKENFSMMHQSKSMHAATYANPRIIYFGNDARLLIAVSGGDSSSSHYEDVETAEFEMHSRRFLYRNIHFNSKRREKPQISPVNPPVCLTCHTSDPKPIWDSYPNWPGAYGETDDFFANDTEGCEGAPCDHVEERTEFLNFMMNRPKKPRYAALKIKEGSVYSPYSTHFKGAPAFRPNLQLTDMLAGYNSKRIYRMIKGHSSYPRFKYLFLMGTMNCHYPSEGVGVLLNQEIDSLFGPPIAPGFRFDPTTAVLHGMGFNPKSINLSLRYAQSGPMFGFIYHFGQDDLSRIIGVEVAADVALEFPEVNERVKFTSYGSRSTYVDWIASKPFCEKLWEDYRIRWPAK